MINSNPTITNITVGALATNCWLYSLGQDAGPSAQESWEPYQGKLCALVDPGADAGVITARLERLSLYPRYILLTHGHFDHVAGLPELVSYYRETYGLHPEIGIHRGDAASLGPKAYQVHRDSFMVAVGNAAYVDDLWEPLPSPTRLLSEGDIIGPFKVIHLPGHSPGSAGFYNETAQVLFSGDTLFSGGIGRTDLPGGDWNTLAASLKRLFTMDKNIKVYPGHGPATTLGDEQSLY